MALETQAAHSVREAAFRVSRFEVPRYMLGLGYHPTKGHIVSPANPF